MSKISKEEIERFFRKDGRINNNKLKELEEQGLTIEDLYCIYYNIEQPRCKECNKKVKLKSWNKGFKTYCSKKCSNKNLEKIKKCIENTDYGLIALKNKEAWKNKSSIEKEVIQKKKEETCLQKYSVDNPAKSSIVKEKVQKNNLLKYGVPWVTQTKLMKEKSRKTKLLRYNNEYFNNPKKIKESERKTKIAKGIWLSEEELTDWELYSRKVRKQTELVYKEYKNEINPCNLERSNSNYHLDHKYSVFQGFKNCIPLYIIASKENLEVIEANKNRKKNTKCSITLEELFKKVINTKEDF